MANRSKLFERASITLVSLWLIAFVAVPNLMVLSASVLKRGEIDLIEYVFTPENYLRFVDPVFFKVILESLKLSFFTTLICLLVGYPFAYALAKAPKKSKNLLLLLVIIPFWTSSLVRTYALIIILKATGLINTVLKWAGLIDMPLKLMYTDGAVLLGLTYTLLPFMILPLYAAIDKLDPRYLEAAADLGAGRLTAFFRVTLPLTTPGIIAGVMLTFLPAMGMFYIPDILGGAKTMLIGNFIRNQFLTARDWPLGSAASIALNVIMLLMLLVYYRAASRTKQEAVL